jgi:hypothetical protein
MIATDRKGNEYKVGDIVQFVDFPVLFKSSLNVPFQIVEVKEVDYAESGFNLSVKNILTGITSARWLDTNWYQHIKPEIKQKHNL